MLRETAATGRQTPANIPSGVHLAGYSYHQSATAGIARSVPVAPPPRPSSHSPEVAVAFNDAHDICVCLGAAPTTTGSFFCSLFTGSGQQCFPFASDIESNARRDNFTNAGEHISVIDEFCWLTYCHAQRGNCLSWLSKIGLTATIN
eukprot:scaffold208742_cov25-Prasinocladus_malaysianus.AAC.1